MANLRSLRISLVTLFLCLSLGSLVILPILNVVGPSTLEISEIDTENSNPLEPAESDDDLAVTSIRDLTIAGLFFSKLRNVSPVFHSAFLLAVSPPPKHT
jgi:hypothetical protein